MQNDIMHHIKCAKGDVGRYVILPGDPGRVSVIAQYLDDMKYVVSNREYTVYTGHLDGERVSVMSTGMGGPSAAIAMEELFMIGADTFVRIGTCGGIDSSLTPGDLIIPTAAIRKDGTGREYLPIEFPAVSNFELTCALVDAAKRFKYSYHTGVVECKDSYYGQHDPDRMPVSGELLYKWNAWKRGGALASEMESSALFIVASTLKARCSSVLLLCRNREREKQLNIGELCVWTMEQSIMTAVEAIRQTIKSDKRKETSAK